MKSSYRLCTSSREQLMDSSCLVTDRTWGGLNDSITSPSYTHPCYSTLLVLILKIFPPEILIWTLTRSSEWTSINLWASTKQGDISLFYLGQQPHAHVQLTASAHWRPLQAGQIHPHKLTTLFSSVVFSQSWFAFCNSSHPSWNSDSSSLKTAHVR